MLSRVAAAVMALRTHNRRRVTGSSGRRREGRESEQQRPNMSRHPFYSAVLLLAVVMMCCCSGAASSQDTSPASGSSKGKLFDWRDKNGETVSSLRVPSLVEMNGDVFAVAEAQCTGTGECVFTGIASELLTLSDEESKELDTNKLKTQVLVNRSSGGEQCPSQTAVLAGTQRVKKVHVSRPTTVVQGSDIYMLAGNYSWTYEDKADSVFQCGLLLVKGNINNEEGSTNKRILWKDTYDLPWISNGRQEQSWTRLIGGGGSGIKIKGDTLLFPLEGTKKEDGKAVSLIMYSSDTAGWVVSREMSADGCGDPSVVEWKDKLMMMTACDDGRRRVYEFNLTESWTEALGTLSRVWGNKHKGNKKGVGNGFITATIENRDVMLVTLPVYSEKADKKENGKNELHLWLTDNTHIVDIGPVSEEDEDAAASSLLYKSGNNKKEELIALYEKKKGEKPSPGMVSVRLTAQLKRVKEVVATWKEVDERVSQLCTTLLAQKGFSSDNACGADKITDGLVGFLSGNFSDGTWRDEYLGVNATVKSGAAGATKTSDGVTFHGAWAEWPVGSQGENQLYHFANYNFTLVATVSIDRVPKEDTPIPLMGVKKMNGAGKNKVFLGLSYSNKNKWQLRCGDEKTTELRSSWKPETTHQVAIVLQNGTQGTAYVDGQHVGVGASCALGSTESQKISHFYIGGDERSAGGAGSKEEVSVTVTNVLLYNRPLSTAEMTALKMKSVNIPKLYHAKTEPRGTPSTPAGQQPSEWGHLVGSSKDASGGVEGADSQIREVNATALSSNLGNVSQENNSDAGAMRGSGLLPSLLLLLGLWGSAAL
ncbi:putative trans-sialidase, Group V [Trypanosoma cruzi]|uniref:Trans-sialidase, putative n=2 Tax=Trypanosoma cruzi TaxID=5693 RepID=Q4DM98_TRYCC|nr:trans-sialidase, putative [Trypanosoma cruzi]EAN93647.1 trans-sialidase, putative [Trypanosoma cruzi]PWU93179.1 putative trans-sialidase, Group V [Trypanosoma cruzi]|eukprot:XP_815498.1 trans-sialidase [Trypanosoma cruzi strain CL Brener]